MPDNVARKILSALELSVIARQEFSSANKASNAFEKEFRYEAKRGQIIRNTCPMSQVLLVPPGITFIPESTFLFGLQRGQLLWTIPLQHHRNPPYCAAFTRRPAVLPPSHQDKQYQLAFFKQSQQDQRHRAAHPPGQRDQPIWAVCLICVLYLCPYFAENFPQVGSGLPPSSYIQIKSQPQDFTSK